MKLIIFTIGLIMICSMSAFALPTIAAIGFGPTNYMFAGESIDAVVVLGSNAPAGGLVINFKVTELGVVIVPVSVTVPEGKNSVFFKIKGDQVLEWKQVILRAIRFDGKSYKDGVLEVNP